MRTNAITLHLETTLSLKSTPTFAKYSKGEPLRASIVEVNGHSIRLKMPDGRITTAEFRSPAQLFVGDQMDLLVVDKTARQLFLQITALNGQSIKPVVSRLEYLLLESGIECTPKNTQNAQLLQKMALPIRPETLSAMSSQSRLSDLPAAQAAFMAANGLDFSEKTIALVRTWLESSPLIDGLEQPLNELLVALKNESSPVAMPAGPDIPARVQVQNAVVTEPQRTGSITVSSAFETAKDGQIPIPLPLESQSGLFSPKETAVSALTPNAALSHLFPEKVAEALKSVSGWEQMLKEVLELPKAERFEAASTVLNALPEATPNHVKSAVFSKLLSLPVLAAHELPALTEAIPNPSILNPTQPNLSNPNLLKPIQEPESIIEQLTSGAKSSPEHKIESHGLLKLYHELFAKLDPTSEENGQQLQRAAEAITEKLQSLHSQVIAQSSEPAARLGTSMEQLISQTKLGTELNNYYYAQLPFRFNEHDQTAELYVMKRNPKSKQQSEENVTILLSLSTESLGQIDSILKVSKNALSLQFCVENPQVESFLQNQLPLLRELMTSTPFTLQSITLKQTVTKLTPLTVNAIVQKELGIALSGIDIRA